MTLPMTLRVLLLAAAVVASGCQKKPEVPPPPTAASLTDDQKAIYAFGTAVGRQIGQQTKQLQLTPDEIETFRTGFSDALTGKTPAIKIEDYEAKFKALAEARLTASAEQTKKQSSEFLANAAKEPGAVQTASGLVYKTLTAGKGAHPKATDKVRVNYQGTLTDGKIFDSTAQRGQPAEFVLNQVIPCWAEGVQRMQVGEKAKLVCPSGIAYGDRGAGGAIPPGATLVFEVELLAINGK